MYVNLRFGGFTELNLSKSIYQFHFIKYNMELFLRIDTIIFMEKDDSLFLPEKNYVLLKINHQVGNCNRQCYQYMKCVVISVISWLAKRCFYHMVHRVRWNATRKRAFARWCRHCGNFLLSCVNITLFLIYRVLQIYSGPTMFIINRTTQRWRRMLLQFL